MPSAGSADSGTQSLAGFGAENSWPYTPGIIQELARHLRRLLERLNQLGPPHGNMRLQPSHLLENPCIPGY